MKLYSGKVQCSVCMHKCVILEGQTGACGVRTLRDGRIYPLNYGHITSLCLDPIEKKPLYRFHPGSYILSIGSYGCNLFCPFCQNHEISRHDPIAPPDHGVLSPEELMQEVVREKRSIGLAYTYNEPLICYEYVRDCSRLIHEAGKANVLVSNGEASQEVLNELLPYMDAMNIDLKGFRPEIYEQYGGSLDMVMDFIQGCVGKTHLEVTSLIVPGRNDSAEDMKKEAQWLASLDPDIPLHITRYFPRYKMTDVPPTSIALLKELSSVAKEHLRYVFLGNV